jgi:protein-S-isoprenylcysteine O-methyltransferase Ste14
MKRPRWVRAALRSIVWFGAAAWWAYLKKPEGASVLAVRSDATGWLGTVLLVVGVALHVWSNVSLARSEAMPLDAVTSLAVRGPYRYVRNPIYLAGTLILLGIYFLHFQWRGADLVAAVVLVLLFHVLVVRIEEPALQKRFGSLYQEYCRQVPRWIPASLGSIRGRPTRG